MLIQVQQLESERGDAFLGLDAGDVLRSAVGTPRQKQRDEGRDAETEGDRANRERRRQATTAGVGDWRMAGANGGRAREMMPRIRVMSGTEPCGGFAVVVSVIGGISSAR